MYKVFIDNSILYIGTSEEDFSTIFKTPYESICFDELILLLNTSELEMSSDVYVMISDSLCEDFKKLFKKHQKIRAAGGVVQRNDEYLFIKRHGLWDIPKGKLEENESIPEGAVREIEEECGISNPVINRSLTTTYHTYVYKGKKVLKETFWFLLDYDKDENLVPQLEEGITEVKWFKRDDFEEIRKNTYPSILDVLYSL